MRRRTVLAAAPALLAGCAGSPPTALAADERQVSVCEYVADVDEPPLAISLALDPALITSESPARLFITVENVGEEPVGTTAPWYKGFNDATYTTDYHLAVWYEDAPDNREDGQWIACFDDDWTPRREDPGEVAPGEGLGHGGRTEEGAVGHTLDPEETGTTEHVIGNDRFREACFPPGRYLYEWWPRYWDSDAGRGSGDRYAFEFTLEVS